MLQLRKANERGDGSFDWLTSYHTFSFADYYDPRYMHFSHLRVINEDIIAPMQGFGMHPHRDMEILTYVLNGRVAHRDSMGNQTEVQAGEFQIMSAGSGVLHSEINPDSETPLHLYQIWIMPNEKGIPPRYSQDRFADKEGATLILSPDAQAGSFKIYQDMRLWRYQYTAGKRETVQLDPNRSYWLQNVKGEVKVNGVVLNRSDAFAIRHENSLTLEIDSDNEFLLFDLV